jgi:hypothetical protein
MIKDPHYLAKVMDAVKCGDPFKILKKKLGNAHTGTNLGNNIAAATQVKLSHQILQHTTYAQARIVEEI